MSDPDDSIWEDVKRTIKPLKGKKTAVIAAEKPKKITIRPRAKPMETVVAAKPPAKSPLPAKQVRKLRSQKIPVEATLDLHGMTLERAHRAVQTFLARARKNHLRCVEIVTGKGSAERGTGQLKRHFPLWLEAEAGILHTEESPQSRGGSFLVMLRRVRNTD